MLTNIEIIHSATDGKNSFVKLIFGTLGRFDQVRKVLTGEVRMIVIIEPPKIVFFFRTIFVTNNYYTFINSI